MPHSHREKGPGRGKWGAGAACTEPAVLGCGVAHHWLQNPNYISLMSTHTVIRGSSGAKL